MEKMGERKHAQKDHKTGVWERAKNTLAAIGFLAVSILPHAANARVREGAGTQNTEKPPISSVRSPGYRTEPERGEVAHFSGGTATVTRGYPDSNLTNFIMLYETKEKNLPAFIFNGPPETGDPVFNLPGRERSIVITENNIITTVGYAAAERGQHNLNMDGTELRGNTYYYDLPPDVRGTEELPDGSRVPKLLSATMVENQDGLGATLFFIGRNGHLRATRVESMSEPYASDNISVNENARLLNAGSVAILAEPGRNVIFTMTADFESHTIVRQAITLPATAEGTPEIRGREGEVILSFNNMELLVLVGEPGNPNSVTIASVER
jgi:hypothetical protein